MAGRQTGSDLHQDKDKAWGRLWCGTREDSAPEATVGGKMAG